MKTVLIKSVFMMAWLLMATAALADIEVHDFASPLEQQRYQSLIEELRCPKCQNANIAESNAPLAKDLRDIVFEQIKAGASDGQIRDFMTQRYGDFILYRPPLKPVTWVLWFGPGLLFLIICALLWRWARRQKLHKTAPLSPEEEARLQALLAQQESAQ